MNTKVFLGIVLTFTILVGGTILGVRIISKGDNTRPVQSVQDLNKLKKDVDKHVERTEKLPT